MSQQLYFVALIPPPKIQAEVKKFKLFASQQFGSSHALKSPAHITLVPPFWWQSALLDEMSLVLRKALEGSPDLEIQLDGFACFKPRVIYIDVIPNPELNNLHRLLKELFRSQWNLSPDRRSHYSPHLTVAFKDLSKSAFFRAWDYFRSQDYKRKFESHSISILVHEEGRWQIERKIPLNTK